MGITNSTVSDLKLYFDKIFKNLDVDELGNISVDIIEPHLRGFINDVVITLQESLIDRVDKMDMEVDVSDILQDVILIMLNEIEHNY